MHNYKRLAGIKAISFDLDDTLYDNGPIIQASEDAQLAYLHKSVEQTLKTDLAFWQENQRQYGKENPAITHNMAKFRQQAIYYGLLKIGLPDKDAHVHALAAYEAFYQRRIKVEIDEHTFELLKALKSRYPLIALTNGTASIEKMGLADIFEFAIHAGDDNLRQKPATDMYFAAAKRLGIECKDLLHVGDHLSYDVKGALNAGCGALWLNTSGKPAKATSSLPHIEIHDLQQMRVLLD